MGRDLVAIFEKFHLLHTYSNNNLEMEVIPVSSLSLSLSLSLFFSVFLRIDKNMNQNEGKMNGQKKERSEV